jgi:exosome complex component RRP40
MASLVLPGDTLPSELIPQSGNRALKLGPGLRHIPPSTVKATIAGTVTLDLRKNAVWIEYNGGRVC